MEDIVSGLVAQTLGQISSADESYRVEQARQDLERAIEEELGNLPPNEFDGDLAPVGSADELRHACFLIREHRASLTYDDLVDPEYLVYEVRITTDSGTTNYWINDYWHNQLLIAVGVIEEATTEEVQLSPEDEALLAQALESEHQEIPVNSQTITVDETTSRFSGAIWYEQIQKQTVILAGVGGIGSYIGFLLGRLKPARLVIYDPDKVETVNMSGQLYSKSDIGSYKVNALALMIKNYAEYYNLVGISERYTANSETADVMICGFDNMEARRIFYQKWKTRVSCYKDEYKKMCLFIDGRLAAEEFQVLSIQGNDKRAMKEYEDKWLFSDAEAEETICSYKQTTFMANMIASVMVNVFVNFVANQCGPIIDRDVPFFISYDAGTMFTKVEI